MAFRSVSLETLVIDDEEPFQALPLYRALKRALIAADHRFLIPAGDAAEVSWDRALFLNLTFWSADEAADVLCNDHIPADVVAHAAWHHVVGRALGRAAGAGPSPALALFFAESIASAFDLYLVGRLLHEAPQTDFITTQIPILRDVAGEAGLSDADFASLLDGVCAAPQRAFEDLRALLFEATVALHACRTVADAVAVLERHQGHRFGPLLHHYQLSNWILYARAYAREAPERARVVRGFDQLLRSSGDGLAWLEENWLGGDPVRLAGGTRAE